MAGCKEMRFNLADVPLGGCAVWWMCRLADVPFGGCAVWRMILLFRETYSS